ncbi:synaptogyrin-1-like isoform X3 [Lampetra fluviatilis]
MEATEAGAAVPAGAAYGAGRAGGAFDPVAFMKQPHSILRVVSWFFSIVVFGCIVNEGYTNNQGSKLHCIFNGNGDACRYGITIGVVAFFACVAFLALDAYFPQISSVKDRKRAVLADLAFSAFWAFMWFVGFCLLTNQWRETPDSKVPNGIGADSARATIAFCFFSIISWHLEKTHASMGATLSYTEGTDGEWDRLPGIAEVPSGCRRGVLFTVRGRWGRRR